MSIFGTTEPTPQDRAIGTRNIIKARARNSLANLKKDIEDSFNLFWYPTAPQTVQMNADAFGTGCVELFEVNTKTVMFILSLDPTWVPPTPGAYTANPDGTITIG